MKRKQVHNFEKLTAQLGATHVEVLGLAKKSPKDALNVFKLTLINSLLTSCNAFLGDRYRPFNDFTTFSVDELPSNSDVSLVLAQYLECAETFRADNIHRVHGVWQWKLEEERGVDDERVIETASPKKLGKG